MDQHFAASSPLLDMLNPTQKDWLIEFAVDDYTHLAAKMGDWRQRLKEYEKFADEDFSDREKARESKEDAIRSIFELQNDTLNVVGGFADFAYATARDDIMGTKPYFAATPEGLEDTEQAAIITKHAHWKLGQTNFTKSLSDILLSAVQLGTALPKTTWRRVTETSYSNETVLCDEKKQPITTATGEFFYPEDAESFEQKVEEGATLPSLRTPKDPTLVIPKNTQWLETRIENVETVFDNAQTDLIHFERFVANPKAPRLDLLETNVYHEFDIKLLDALDRYGIPLKSRKETMDSATLTEDVSPEESAHPESYNPATNPEIRLVEGYVRVDPFESGTPVRVYIVFDPKTKTIFFSDFLANITPGGKLPIFAVPCYPQPGTWMGKGFYERYEKVQEYIDKQFSAVGYRNRMNSNPINFLDANKLEDGEEIEDIFSAPGKTYQKKDGVGKGEVLEFVEMPDLDNRTIEMMNIMMQVAQMRTGISSAAQGELSALPDTNTATGVSSILSRAATLLKWPVGEMAEGISHLLNYNMVLIYANQDFDETFTWGEGKNVQLLKIDRKAANNLHYHVKILLTQSHNREQLEASNSAIAIMAQYAALPELEKLSQRPLYIQALTSLKFENAEEIVREAVDLSETEEVAPTEEASQ